MSRIKILSEHLANQIAAGEVIERPASVVKELLENSIDAGAAMVRIEVEGNGTKMIRVIDDGAGMDSDDVLLCLERHATSKLGDGPADSSRLNAIRSLGFRGEAIPSIASVAKVTITSRTDQDELGTRVDIRYGKIVKIHETGCSKGTAIEIRDLFGNVPARKKFLKSTRTELSHIEETIKNYGLANSRLGLSYTVNGSTVHDFPADTDTLEGRVKMLYGRENSEPLIRIRSGSPALVADSGGITVSGFLVAPENSFGASRLRLFVNGRAVRDRMMAHAAAEGLAGYLMKGRSPAGVLFVSLPYEAVDVNVHPAKQEVRFRQADTVHRLIVDAVRAAMADYQEHAKDFIFGSGQHSGSRETAVDAPPPVRTPDSREPYPLWSRPAKARPPGETALGFSAPPAGENRPASLPQPGTAVTAAEPAGPFQRADTLEDQAPETLKPIGQIMDLYLLCEARKDGESYLVVIDQHAVHERVLFENLKKQFYDGRVASQNLLFPKMIELPPESGEIIEKNREQISRLGIIIEEFGGAHYIIKAVPSVVSHLSPDEILAGILSRFTSGDHDSETGRKRTDATRFDDILSTMACKAAIKAGQNLLPQEMSQLLKLMEESRAFTHCPHGRPVVRMFSAAEIKKWFHRT